MTSEWRFFLSNKLQNVREREKRKGERMMRRIMNWEARMMMRRPIDPFFSSSFLEEGTGEKHKKESEIQLSKKRKKKNVFSWKRGNEKPREREREKNRESEREGGKKKKKMKRISLVSEYLKLE